MNESASLTHNALMLCSSCYKKSSSHWVIGSGKVVEEEYTSCVDTSVCPHNLASQGQGEINTMWFTDAGIGAVLYSPPLTPHHATLHTFCLHM